MFPFKYPVEQTDPPRSPRETLPTMYDLPSEDPEEPGLPDEYHDLQPQLLSRTFQSPRYPSDQVFSASDLNLYYDIRHSRWYKRPDWFVVVGVPRLYDDTDLRLSYVVWQEGVNPFVVVELLSPGTEGEDLGENVRFNSSLESAGNGHEGTDSAENGQATQSSVRETPPRKWEVYEQILRVPYYVVFNRYTDQLRVFTLNAGHYQELELEQPRVWIPELELGLGLWQGEYEGIERLWLRWYDAQDSWIPTDTEQERQEKELAQQQAQQERQQKELAQQRAEQAESLLEEERREKERLLERLKMLEGNSDELKPPQ